MGKWKQAFSIKGTDWKFHAVWDVAGGGTRGPWVRQMKSGLTQSTCVSWLEFRINERGVFIIGDFISISVDDDNDLFIYIYFCCSKRVGWMGEKPLDLLFATCIWCKLLQDSTSKHCFAFPCSDVFNILFMREVLVEISPPPPLPPTPCSVS